MWCMSSFHPSLRPLFLSPVLSTFLPTFHPPGTGSEVAVAAIELVQMDDPNAASALNGRDDLDALDDSDDEGSIHGIHYGELVDAVELENANLGS